MSTIAKKDSKIDKVKLKKYTFKYVVSIVRLIFIIGMCFVVLFPLFQKIVLSIMSSVDLYDATVTYIPKHLTTANYSAAWTKLGGISVFLRTLGLTVCCALLNVVCATLVGYGLARFKFKGNGLVFGLVILALVLPSDLLFIPRYMMFSSVGLLNDSWVPMLAFSITCTGLKASLYIFLMRQFFKGQPHELEEAAYVDGAGPLKTFISIMLPGAVSMMITVFLFAFVWQWLDDSYTTVFMRKVELIPTKYTSLHYDFSDNTALAALNISLTKSAGVIIIIAPLVALYAFTQRYFVESISRSGLVG